MVAPHDVIKVVLEQLNNTTRLELVCIRFWGAFGQTLLWILLQEGVDELLGFIKDKPESFKLHQ